MEDKQKEKNVLDEVSKDFEKAQEFSKKMNRKSKEFEITLTEIDMKELEKDLFNRDKKNIRLGMEIQKLQESYYYNNIVKCVKGDYTNTYGLEYLMPLYKEYGFEKVNEIILELDAEKVRKAIEEAKEQEEEKDE